MVRSLCIVVTILHVIGMTIFIAVHKEKMLQIVMRKNVADGILVKNTTMRF